MNLTGIKDAEYLASFLGKRIAIRVDKNAYELYPILYSICENGSVEVKDSAGNKIMKFWSDCENPYVILQTGVKVEIK
jgi:hypothetical protein